MKFLYYLSSRNLVINKNHNHNIISNLRIAIMELPQPIHIISKRDMSFRLSKWMLIPIIFLMIQGLYAQKSFCLYFETGKSVLTQVNQAEIDKICQPFSIKDTLQIEIIGYYDDKTGKPTTDLARKRCYAVWDYLLQKRNFIIFKGQMLPSSSYKPENLPIAETPEMTQKRVSILFIPVKKGKLTLPSIAESLPNMPAANASPSKNNTTQTHSSFGSNLPKANPNVSFGTFSTPNINEADSVITSRTGTTVKILAGTFAPFRIKDIQFEIMEFLKPCELFSLDIQMRTIDGDLLMSDGLIIVQASKSGKIIQPQKPIEIWVPSEKLDTTMRLYIGDRTLDNRTIWRRASERLAFHITDARYYSFQTSKLGWFCIQKPVDPSISAIISAKEKSKKNRFFVKNNSHLNPQVNVFYLDNHTYYELSANEEGIFSMPKFSDPKNIIIVSKVHAPNNKTWYFSKRLSELEVKGGSYMLNTEDYIVRRPNSPKNTSQGNELTMDEVLYKLCGMFSEMEGI